LLVWLLSSTRGFPSSYLILPAVFRRQHPSNRGYEILTLACPDCLGRQKTSKEFHVAQKTRDDALALFTRRRVLIRGTLSVSEQQTFHESTALARALPRTLWGRTIAFVVVAFELVRGPAFLEGIDSK
jgi:hypothetical protein